MTETFKSRVSKILDDINRSKSWLADNMGISRQALNYLLAHTTGEKYTSQIAEILNVNPDWLISGVGDSMLETNFANVIPLLIPSDVIPWLKKLGDNFYETIPAACNETTDTFAIILDNSSMEAEFARNSILIFRASKKPLNGDYILIQLKNSHQEPSFVFRKYVMDGSGVYLKALDPTFRTITEKDNFNIIGTLIEQRRRFYD